MKKLLLLVALAGCEDALDQRLDVIAAPRVLAVISEPAEALPGATVAYHALVAAPDGTRTDAPAYALCLAPKPPTEDNAVSDACLGSDQIQPLTAAMATIPMDACIRFGPDVPPGGFRPRDPDPTGGYYQPVRADTRDAGVAFGFTRITCNLPNAPGDVAHDYQINYRANVNPTLDPVGVPASVAAGSDVTLTASWPADAVESYLYYDPAVQQLVTRREAMRVSWFTTAGDFTADATAVGEDDPALAASITWHAPATAGIAHLWFVLRDSRGGIATREATVQVVQP